MKCQIAAAPQLTVSLFFHFNPSYSMKKHARTSKGMLKDTVRLTEMSRNCSISAVGKIFEVLTLGCKMC